MLRINGESAFDTSPSFAQLSTPSSTPASMPPAAMRPRRLTVDPDTILTPDEYDIARDDQDIYDEVPFQDQIPEYDEHGVRM